MLFVRLHGRPDARRRAERRIRRQVRENTTPRHVPGRIVQVTDIPRTKSGKIVELAVRDVVHGREVKNRDALANPEALEQFKDRRRAGAIVMRLRSRSREVYDAMIVHARAEQSQRMLRPAPRDGRPARRVGPCAQPVAPARRAFVSTPPIISRPSVGHVRKRANGHGRVSFASPRTLRASRTDAEEANDPSLLLHHRLAGGGAAVGRGLRVARRELRCDRSRPCAVMGGVCLRAARIGLVPGMRRRGAPAYPSRASPTQRHSHPAATSVRSGANPPAAAQSRARRSIRATMCCGCWAYGRARRSLTALTRSRAPSRIITRATATPKRASRRSSIDGHLTLTCRRGANRRGRAPGPRRASGGRFSRSIRDSSRATSTTSARSVRRSTRLLAPTGRCDAGRPPRTGNPATDADIDTRRRHAGPPLGPQRACRAARVAQGRTSASRTGADDREDLFSPVDGFAPALGFTSTIFDHGKFDHTVIDGYASYKFGREDPGLFAWHRAAAFRRAAPVRRRGDARHQRNRRSLASDRPIEQSLVSVAFKNTFRDYYRRQGRTALRGPFRPAPNNEFCRDGALGSPRTARQLDRLQLLSRRSATSGRIRSVPISTSTAWVIGYTFDTAPVVGPGPEPARTRAICDDSLFGFGLRQQPGLRLEWTSELAGHGLGGDARFERHIFNMRGYLAFSDRQLFSSRATLRPVGWRPAARTPVLAWRHRNDPRLRVQGGQRHRHVAVERRISRPPSSWRAAAIGDMLAVFGFYDSGRISGPLNGSTTDWLNGLGVGISVASIRVEFGFSANDIPQSRQILVRFGPTF